MTFCDRPLVAFKKDWNLHDILVHSNLCSHANSTPGTLPFSTDRCKACPHLHADTSIRGPNGHMSMKRSFTRQSDNLAYAITCQSCNLIYVGETSRSFTVHFRSIWLTFATTAANLYPNILTLPVIPLWTSKLKGYGNCMGIPTHGVSHHPEAGHHVPWWT